MTRFQRFTAKHTVCTKILCTLIVLLLLATLGLGAWGLYEGRNATKDISTNFFKVLDTAQLKVRTDNMTIAPAICCTRGTSRQDPYHPIA